MESSAIIITKEILSLNQYYSYLYYFIMISFINNYVLYYENLEMGGATSSMRMNGLLTFSSSYHEAEVHFY